MGSFESDRLSSPPDHFFVSDGYRHRFRAFRSRLGFPLECEGLHLMLTFFYLGILMSFYTDDKWYQKDINNWLADMSHEEWMEFQRGLKSSLDF